VPHQSETAPDKTAPGKTAPDETGFADLFDGMQDPALILDGESGRIRTANQAACTLLDYPRETLVGMSAADIHPHELPRLNQYLAEVRARGAWMRDDLSCRTRKGDFVPAEIRSTAFRAAGREEILVILRDLRGQQLAEVGQSVRKLVHDLRNTLATAQLLSDRLQGHADPEVRAGADVMSRSLERALDLCQQTLRAGRSEEHRPQRTRFLLDDIVEEVAATAILPGGIGPELRFDPGRTTILDADFDQVYRIVLNLVRNAADAGARVVTVAGERHAGAARLTVADDGPGLPPDICDRLAQEKPELSAGSSGMGLMIASELARAHGGALNVAETGEAGTRFCIDIPDADPDQG